MSKRYDLYVISKEKYSIDTEEFLKTWSDELETEFGGDELDDSDIEWFISEIIHTYGPEIRGVYRTDQVDTEYEVERRR